MKSFLLNIFKIKLSKLRIFCTKIHRKVNNKQLLIKPAGLYAIKYIRGSYDDLIKAYAQFVEELHNMNYKVIGALYEEDMLNYLSETDFNYYFNENRSSYPLTKKAINRYYY